MYDKEKRSVGVIENRMEAPLPIEFEQSYAVGLW